MKIFAVYSDHFERLRDEWFLGTLPADMVPVLARSPSDSVPGDGGWGSPDWYTAIDFKLDFVLDSIRKHPGEVVCFSDIDVQFFGSFAGVIQEALIDHDVAGMRESAVGGMNGGFYAVRCTPQVATLWEEALYADKREAQLYEQDALNALLEEGANGVRYTLLPDTFWASHRHLVFKEEEPAEMLVNHVTSCPSKIAELRRVREKYSLGRKSS